MVGILIIAVLEFSSRKGNGACLGCPSHTPKCIYMCVLVRRAQLDHCLADLPLPALALAGTGPLLSLRDR